jgi:hypothetical protein
LKGGWKNWKSKFEKQKRKKKNYKNSQRAKVPFSSLFFRKIFKPKKGVPKEVGWSFAF